MLHQQPQERGPADSAHGTLAGLGVTVAKADLPVVAAHDVFFSNDPGHSRRLQARSACHAQIPARIGQRWAIICGNGVGLEKHSPYASSTGQLGRVVQSNKVYPPQEVFLVSASLASRQISAIR